MSVYSRHQRLFIDAFMSQVNDLLNHCQKSSQDETSFLDTLSSSVDALSAGITLASLITAVPTLGTSVAAGVACIVLLKTGTAVYRYVRSYSNQEEPIDDLIEMAKAEKHLSLLILLRQTALLMSTRYAQVLNHIVDEKDIKNMAEFAFARAMKKLALELQSQKKANLATNAHQLIFPKETMLVDSLLSNVNLGSTYDSKKVTLKKVEQRFGFLKQLTTYTKLVFERPRWVIYEEDGSCDFYASNSENLVKRDSTLPEYGVITLPKPYLTTPNIAINTAQLKKLNKAEVVHASELLLKVCIQHQVKRKEVEDYLLFIRSNPDQISLNDYLSLRYNTHVVACCHDAELVGLDLSGGNFSEVDFHHASLQGCNLSSAVWKDAHLEWTQFESNDLTEVDFSDAYLEFSFWRWIDFKGNFSNARMNGSHLTDCNLSLTLLQQGCDWELCIRERVTVNHEQITFNKQVEETLTRELQERIQQGIEFGRRLDTLSNDVKILQSFQQDQEHRWVEQEEVDRVLQTRVSLLEAEQDIAHTIKRHWETWFNTAVYQEAKKSYVELNVSCMTDKGPAKLLFSDRLLHFVESEESFLLIRGEVGSGKSLTINLFQEDLLRRYQDPEKDWLPFCIKPNEENFKKILSDPQLYALAKQHCVIILDGLEECMFSSSKRQALEEFITFSRLWEPHCLKIIAIAQSRFLLEFEQEFLQLFNAGSDKKLEMSSVCEVLPPSASQTKQMLRSYHVNEDNIKLLSGIQLLFKTPLMFKILAEVIQTRSTDRTLPTSRVKLYDEFCSNWFNHIKNRLPANEASEDHLQFHIQDLAFEMFKNGAYWIERPFHRERQNRQKMVADPLRDLFDNQTNRVSPLLMTKQTNSQNQMVMRYEFIHRSFRDYGVAQKLLNDFLGVSINLKNCLINWNHHLLSEFPDVLFFLQGLIQDHPEKETMLRYLLEMVLASRSTENTAYLYASANALTLLCRLGVDFCGQDLSHIRVPRADLTGGLFAFTNFSYSDLTETCFHEAMLLGCNMNHAILTNVRYLNAASYMQAEKPPQTFAVYPYTAETIIAYDMPPEAGESLHRIAIARLSDGKMYQSWPAHGQPINAMAWTTHNGIARLASAGVGGTIRIWAIKSNGEAYQEVAKLDNFKHKCTIVNLSWFADGNLLAIQSVDNIVRIWNVNEKNRVFKSEIHQGSISAIACGHSDVKLFSASEDGWIYAWDNPLANNVSCKKLDLRAFLAEHQTGKVTSIALSRDESLLALGCATGDIMTITLNTPTPTVDFRIGHKDKITSLVWAEHALMSASDDHSVRIWTNKEEPTIFQHDDRINKIELSANGLQLLSGGGGRSSHICAWNTLKPQQNQLIPGQLGNVSCLASYKAAPSSIGTLAAGFVNGAVIVWSIDTTTRPIVSSILSRLKYSDAPISHVKWSSDGRYLASMGQDRTILIQEIGNPQCSVAVIRAKAPCWFNDMQWLSTQTHRHYLAAGSSDGLIYIYDAKKYISSPSRVIESKKDTQYVNVSHSEMVIQEHPSESKPTIPLKKAEESIRCFTVAPNTFDQENTWLLSSRSQMISVWVLRHRDLEMNQCIHQFLHPNGGAIKLEWSPNGHYIISKDKDQTIYVWDSVKYICLRVHEESIPIRSLIWHTEWLVLSTQRSIKAWHMPSNPNWATLAKEFSIGACHLAEEGEQLVIAKEKGIYLLNFTQLLNQPLSTATWVGSLQKVLVLDQYSLVDAVGLTTIALNYIVPKGAIINPVITTPSFFSKLLMTLTSSNKPTIEALPPASNPTELFKRFGVFPGTPALERTELSPVEYSNPHLVL